MSIWYPRISRRDLPGMLRISVLCAIAAGIYGILHDQLTYTISPDYFTHIKFRQFAFADFGLPPRILVAEIGFLASWWVGLAGGWLLARIGLADFHTGLAHVLAIIAGIAFIAAVLAGLFGWVRSYSDLGGRKVWQQTLSSVDLRRLIIVAYVHWGSYIGGCLGLVAASLYVKRGKDIGLLSNSD